MSNLDRLISCINNETIYIQMHNYPDQDALASAWGLKQLLKRYNIKSHICYDGLIDKDNTIKMLNVLGIHAYHISELSISETDEIVVVDAQKSNMNVTKLRGQIIGCIDHHFSYQKQNYKFEDIRSSVGACSSIIASYFYENNINMDSSVATALLYGLRMDTRNMSRGVSELDLSMFTNLYQMANQDNIRIFDNNCLRTEDLKAYADVINTLEIHNDIGFSKIYFECGEAVLASVADFLLTLSSVKYSVVCCRRSGGIKISIRSEEERVDASAMILNALDGIDNAGGGGHSDMAAGFISNINDTDVALKCYEHIKTKCISFIENIENGNDTNIID